MKKYTKIIITTYIVSLLLGFAIGCQYTMAKTTAHIEGKNIIVTCCDEEIKTVEIGD